MTITLHDVTTSAVGLFFFVTGCMALVNPQKVVGMFGATAETKESRAEVRAVYGGFGVALGGCIFSLRWWPPEQARGAVLALAILVAGTGIGRILGGIVDKETRFHPTWTLVLLEVALTVALLVR